MSQDTHLVSNLCFKVHEHALGVSMRPFKAFSRLFFPILLVFVSPIMAQLYSDTENLKENVILIDHFGRKISLLAPVNNVVSLSPGITETVFALGYGDRLIGRTAYCDFPSDVVHVASVGNLDKPDIERIVALSPDVVIASTHFTEESLRRLDATGQNVAILMGQDSFQGVYDGVIRPTALLLGDIAAGETLIASMRATKEEAMKRVAEFPYAPSVYYVVGFGEGGDWTAGGDTFIGNMIEMAGGRNIAADIRGWTFSLEAIVDRDPDIILIPPWAEKLFSKTPVYEDLRAVREGHVYVIDEDSIVRQGPRLADGYAVLVNAIGSFFK